MRKEKKLPSVSADMLDKVTRAMKKRSSRKTGKVSITRAEVATKLGVSVRTVDRAIVIMKEIKVVVSKNKMYYIY
jgi:DNA-binding transcriptional regulator YhcF (GntR family)